MPNSRALHFKIFRHSAKQRKSFLGFPLHCLINEGESLSCGRGSRSCSTKKTKASLIVTLTIRLDLLNGRDSLTLAKDRLVPQEVSAY